MLVSLAALSFAQSPQTPPPNSPNANDEDTNKPDKSKSPSCYYAPVPPGTVEAMKANFIGTVRADVTISVEGKIENIKFLKSPGLGLDESIATTLRRWKCRPALGPDGKPVQITVPFTYTFNRYPHN